MRHTKIVLLCTLVIGSVAGTPSAHAGNGWLSKTWVSPSRIRAKKEIRALIKAHPELKPQYKDGVQIAFMESTMLGMIQWPVTAVLTDSALQKHMSDTPAFGYAAAAAMVMMPVVGSIISPPQKSARSVVVKKAVELKLVDEKTANKWASTGAINSYWNESSKAR